MQGRTLIWLGFLAAVALAAPSGAGAASITYKTDSVQVDPGETSDTAIAVCSNNRHVLGGGVFTSVGIAVTNVSIPVDGADSGPKPDDAWVAVITNHSGVQASLTAYAICAKATPKYRGHDTSVTDELSTGEDCPSGTRATGAGVLTTSAAGGTFIRTWAPYDFIDGEPDATAAVNGSGTATDVEVYVICSDDLKLSYERKKLTIPAGGDDEKSVKCPGGRKVVGGGGTQTTIGDSWDLRTVMSAPSDEPSDGDTEPDDSWRIEVDNFSGEEREVPVVAVCAK